MAEEPFSGLNEQLIKNAQKIKSEVGEIKGAIDRLNRSLGEEKDLLDAIKSAFSGISNSADKVGKLQDSVKNSNKGIVDALKQQKEQLNIIENLNAQIDILYTRAETKSGRFRENLREQAQNTAELRDRAKQLADIFGEIAEDSAKLDKSTIFFSKISEILKGTPILKSFAGPFEAAAKAARQTVLDNAKIANIKETISNLSEEELRTGKGLTKEKLKQKGLSEVTGDLEGKNAAAALRNFQATTKQANALISGLSTGFKSIEQEISNFFKSRGGIGALTTGAVELFKFVKDAMFAAKNVSKDAIRKAAPAKNTSISGTINTLTKEELRTGKGLTKERLQQLGLTEAAKYQSGAAAASALRDFQATTKAAENVSKDAIRKAAPAKNTSISGTINTLTKEELRTGKELTKEKTQQLGSTEAAKYQSGAAAASALRDFQATTKQANAPLNRTEKLLKERLTRAGAIARGTTEAQFRELLNVVHDSIKEGINDISEAVSKSLVNYESITRANRELGEALKEQQQHIKDNPSFINKVNQVFKETDKLARSLVQNQEDLVTGELTALDVTKDLAGLAQVQLTTELARIDAESKIKEITKELETASEDQKVNLNVQLLAYQKILDTLKNRKEEETNIQQTLEEQLATASAIDTKVGIGGKILKGLDKIPGIGKLLDFSAAEKAMRSVATTGGQAVSSFQVLSSGAKALGPSLKAALGPLGLITMVVEAIKFIVDAMFAADNRITNIAKSLSISKENAAGVYKNLTNLKGSLDTIYATTENIVEAFNQVSTATSFIGVATKDQIETQIILTKNLGLQVEEAQQLQGLFAANNIESSKGVDIVYDQVAAFANENKLLASGAKTLKEIQNTSKLILVNFKGNVGELTKTILEAKKLGLSLDEVNKVAGSLLNFEESISAELEAELLLGKDINLERARLFALNNDIAGVTKEIANQGITIESFSRMNRIQQEAIAKTLGMQAEELGKALYDAQVIEKLGGRDLEQKREAAKRQREIAEASGDAKKIAEAMNEEARIAAVEKQILTGKDIQNAEKSVTIQQNFNNLLERAKEIFSDVFTGERLNAFADGLERFIKAIESGRSLASIFFFGLDTTGEKNQKRIEASQKRESEIAAERSHFYGGPEYQKNMARITPKIATVDNNKIKVTKSGQMYTEEDIQGFAAVVQSNKEQKELAVAIENLNAQLNKGITANAYLDSNKLSTGMNVARPR